MITSNQSYTKCVVVVAAVVMVVDVVIFEVFGVDIFYSEFDPVVVVVVYVNVVKTVMTKFINNVRLSPSKYKTYRHNIYQNLQV